jgi:hypothetical protein
MRVTSIETPPLMAFTWPSSELPMPNGTTGIRSSAHSFTIADTSAVVVGKTTKSGSPGACHDSPWLWCSRTASDVEMRSPRIARRALITIHDDKLLRPAIQMRNFLLRAATIVVQ